MPLDDENVVPEPQTIELPPIQVRRVHRRFEDFGAALEYSPKVKPTLLHPLENEIRAGILNDDTLLNAIDSLGVATVVDIVSNRGARIRSCNVCSRFRFVSNMQKVYGGHYFVCKGCTDDLVTCYTCESLIRKDDNIRHYHTHEMIRESVGNEVNPNHEVNILRELGTHFYSTDQDKIRFGKPMFFGVELELEKRDGIIPPDLVLKVKHTLGSRFAIAAYDGSLSARDGRRGAGGFEVITLPATYRYHLHVAGWKQFFEIMSPFCLEKPPTAGLHFHISSNSMTKATIAKVAGFMNDPVNTRFLRMIADRDFTAPSPNGRVYAGIFEDLRDRVNGVVTHKIHLKGCPMAPGARAAWKHYVKDKLIHNDWYGNPIIQSIEGHSAITQCNCPDGQYDYLDHYAAFNLKTKHPTVEFRIFQGSMNIDHFFASMDFCRALIAFCEATAFGNLTYQSFLEWFKINRHHHPKLAKWLVLFGYIEKRGKKKE